MTGFICIIPIKPIHAVYAALYLESRGVSMRLIMTGIFTSLEIYNQILIRAQCFLFAKINLYITIIAKLSTLRRV